MFSVPGSTFEERLKLSKMYSYKILLIGLGKVSLGYDLMHQNSNIIGTHLNAMKKYSQLYDLDLEFFGVDPSRDQQIIAARNHPDLHIYSSLNDVPKYDFDIVLNCTPINITYQITLEIVNKVSFRHLFIEKPGWATVEEFSSLNLLMQSDNRIQIIFPRRSLASTVFLKDLIQNYSQSNWEIEIVFSGSRINILCHFLDLVNFLVSSLPVFQRQKIFKNLLIVNSSSINNGDHAVKIDGAIKIEYLRGGEYVIIKEASMVRQFDFSNEIRQQVMHSSFALLDFVIFNSESPFPRKMDSIMLRSYGAES